MTHLRRNAWILGLLPALVLWFPGLASLGELPAANDIFCSDFLHLNLPLKHELALALRHGHLPLWTPGIGTGVPLLAEGQVGALYPLNWLLFGLLPLGPALALTLLLHLLLAGVFCFLLLRELDIEPLPALLGVLVFVFGAFFIEHLKHLNMLQAAAWLPLALWCVERGARRRDLRYFLGAGAVVALQLLAGHAQIAWLSGLTVAAAILALPLRADAAPPRRFVVQAGLLAAVSSVLFSAAQTLPTLELARQSKRAAVSFEWATLQALAPRHLQTLLFPFPYGNPADGSIRPAGMPFWENWMYIGLLPLAFALFGLVLARRQRRLWFYAAALPLAVLLSLGASGGLYRLLFLLPGTDMFQYPQRFLLVGQLCLAVLAAFGLQHALTTLRQRQARAWLAPALAAVVLIGSAADLYAVDASLVKTMPSQPWLAPPALAKAVQPGIAGYRAFPILPESFHNHLFWKAGGWQGDGALFLRHRDSLQPNLNLLASVPIVTAYVGLMPREMRETWGDQSAPGRMQQLLHRDANRFVVEPEARALLNLYSVRYLTAVLPLSDPELTEIARFGPYRLFENPTALPRARIEAAAGQATLVQDEATLVAIDARLQQPGLLVLADLDYPGWQATLDGHDVAIQRKHGTMRGVPMPAGPHRVVFRYDPALLWLGLALTGVGLGGALLSLGRLKPDN